MKQIFYTQEGTPYVLRTIVKNGSNVVIAATTSYQMYVLVNLPNLSTALSSSNKFATNNGIIPISASLSFVNTTGVNKIDVTSPYYYLVRGENTTYNSVDFIPGLSKMIPLITQNYYSDDSHYSYSILYGQAVFADKDFIDPTGGLNLFFTNTQANALTLVNGTNPSAVAGTYSSCFVFTYFEKL